MLKTSQKQGASSTALKALRALEVVADSREPLSVADAASLLGEEKVTTYRMMVTLEQAGYVVRDPVSKRYSLSYKVVSLSRNLLAENEVSKQIQETLRSITHATQETLHYSVLDGFEAVLVYRVKGSQLVSVDFQIGDRSPLNCTSIGKALLAYQDDEFVDRFIEHGLEKRTEKTITDPEKLRTELRRIRKQGYALDEREFASSMRCVAVPVFSKGGVYSGLSISGPDSRFSRNYLLKLKDEILSEANELSRRLGGKPWV